MFNLRLSNLRVRISTRLFSLLISCSPYLCFAQDTGLLAVTIVDSNQRMIPARVWVDADGERHFKPEAPSTCVPYRNDRSFSCDGQFEMRIPVGSATIHVERGKEWLPVDQEIRVTKDQTLSKTIVMKRWINMPAEGYYSTDMHVHFGYDDLRVLKQLALADDVHLVPAFTYWLRGSEPSWKGGWPSWTKGESIQVDQTHHVTRANLEIERIARSEMQGGSVGASFIYNLRTPVSVDRYDTRYPTDTTLCLLAKQQSPNCVIDTDKPSWAETVIGAALGIYDTAQLCHNHYHRNNTIPGGWGMIGPLSENEKELDVKNELFHRTNEQYYSWLNCGIRMAVSGGSAMGVMPVPMGYSRSYAKVHGVLTPEKYWRAVKAGNTFATSGPLLTMMIDSHDMGSTIHRESNSTEPLSIQLHLRSIEKLESLEVVHNGQIIQKQDLSMSTPNPALNIRQNWNFTPKRSGWFVARALFLAPDGQLRQAHTSPIYIIIDEKPIAFKEDAEYMTRWAGRLVEIASLPDRYRSEADLKQVLSVYQKARDFYQRVVKESAIHWND